MDGLSICMYKSLYTGINYDLQTSALRFCFTENSNHPQTRKLSSVNENSRHSPLINLVLRLSTNIKQFIFPEYSLDETFKSMFHMWSFALQCTNLNYLVIRSPTTSINQQPEVDSLLQCYSFQSLLQFKVVLIALH